MKFTEWLHVEGDVNFRGECPVEDVEHVTFFNQLRIQFPELHAIAVHPKNEAKRTGKDFYKAKQDKLRGALNTGASDVVIPCSPAIVIELKRKDHTQSHLQPGQQEYLLQCQQLGSKVCVALGWEAAINFIKNHINT